MNQLKKYINLKYLINEHEHNKSTLFYQKFPDIRYSKLCLIGCKNGKLIYTQNQIKYYYDYYTNEWYKELK